jgi:hypothetical protein
LRRGVRLLWFWCELGDAGCQRTLEARPERRRVAAGEQVIVRVVGYDDEGRGAAVSGATVRLGSLQAQTGADGRATLVMPAGARRVRVTAAKQGLVPSFPAAVLTP